MAAITFTVELEKRDQDGPSGPDALKAESTYKAERAVETVVKDLLDLDKQYRKYIDGQRKAILKTWIELDRGGSPTGMSLPGKLFESKLQKKSTPSQEEVPSSNLFIGKCRR